MGLEQGQILDVAHDDTSKLTQLGSKYTEYKTSGPSDLMLETFTNQFPNRDYLITHKTSEFSSLCPKTGQPDFASVDIQMVSDKVCVETKSLKLYLFAYRNEGSFMETITNRILDDLVKVTSPRKCKVQMTFSPRGGIQTTVVAEHPK